MLVVHNFSMIDRYLLHFQYWFQNIQHKQLLDDIFLEVTWILLTLVVSAYTSQAYHRYAERQLAHIDKSKLWARKIWEVKEKIAYPLALVGILFLYIPIGGVLGLDTTLVFMANQLAVAFLIIRMVTHVIYNQFYTRFVSWVIWILAALKIMGLWTPVQASLEQFTFLLNESETNLWLVAKGVAVFFIIVWIGIQLSRIFDAWISRIEDFSPSHRVLAQKFIRVVIIVSLVLFGLHSVGMKLQTLTIFSGALGVGLGFGMQKVVSNFISGIILLMDKSIKPGDVIAIDAGKTSSGPGGGYMFGWVQSLGARYVSLITRDGMEHLIPNEMLITDHVENWSHSNNEIRLKMRFNITYDSDVEKAMDIMRQVAEAQERIIRKEKIAPRVVGLDEDGVALELRLWISDPSNGVTNIRSAIYVDMLKEFKQQGIRIPHSRHEVILHDISDDVADKIAKKILKVKK